MKKIGILFGAENSFPNALINYINSKKDGAKAASILIGAVRNTDKPEYDVILDRISHFIPMYQSYLKMAVFNGSKVINSPSSNCVDNNFFQTVFAKKNKLKVPKTVLLPSKELPEGVNPEHLHNLIYPINWEEVFDFVGFPAILKPNKGYNLYNAYKVYNPSEFFSTYDLTGKNAMILQESIQYDEYFRVFAIGKTDARVISYDPIKPIHLRYNQEESKINTKLKKEIENTSLLISEYFDLYFNSVEFAIKEGNAYIINFLNPAPKTEKEYVREDDFNWIVEKTGDLLISLCK